jgi:xanthosine utilization system XapX-like protein
MARTVTRIKTYLLILGTGLVTAFIFASLTQGTPAQSRTFAVLATVQGAFVGIVFSIFVLASQVSATEFSPLTLEQLSKSRTFAGLLSYYVFSILVSVYFVQYPDSRSLIQLYPKGWFTPTAATGWNVNLGIGVGLATISLLSLLIARQLLVDLTSPEKLLKRTAQDVTKKSLHGVSDSADGSDIDQPQRTPLLTIERILESSADRGDEYTVQSAIYEMHIAIINLITEEETDLSSHSVADEATLTNLEFQVLLGRWKTCLHYGKVGSIQRRKLVAQYHRNLLTTLTDQNEYNSVRNNLDELSKLCMIAYEEGSTDPEYLQEFDRVFSAGLQVGANSILDQVQAEFSNICNSILEPGDIDRIRGEQREVFSNLLIRGIEYIENVTESDEIEPRHRHSFAESTFDYLNSAIRELYSLLDDFSDTDAIKQNILVDLQRALTTPIHKCSSIDESICDHLLIAYLEVSKELSRNPKEAVNNLLRDGDSEEKIEDRLRHLSNQDFSPVLGALEAPPKDIRSMIASAGY